ncbi:MAG: hypothetical protein HYX69_00995 [Planctomycetia bacterium]|nr:hypothetical protein [Planctomycetia bacterium]
MRRQPDVVAVPGPAQVSVVGGAQQTGGLDVLFNDVASPGNLTAQAIQATGLSLPAYDALAAETNFHLAGDGAPQIWDVHFDGQLAGLGLARFARAARVETRRRKPQGHPVFQNGEAGKWDWLRA